MSSEQSVSVVAPARLHMGFLDPNASLGRKFGSIGIALNEISTRVIMSRDPSMGVSGPQSARGIESARKMTSQLGLPAEFSLKVIEAIPEHVGLGSGTQMSIAVGVGLNELYGLGLSVREIARITARGARSGIGIGCFEQGGLIVDGGRADATVTPPVICRMEVPKDWRFILVFDERGVGLNGFGEIEAFKQLSEFPEERAARICHLLLLRGLPALVERDCENFGTVVTEIQQSVGDYFAPAQGGRFMSSGVEKAIHWLGENGAQALGQSSWGPTGFCLIPTEARARQLLAEVRSYFQSQPQLRFELVSARNRGGESGSGELEFDTGRIDDQSPVFLESGAQ